METARKLQAAPKFAGRAVVERIMALIEQSAELTVQRRHSVRLIQPSTGLSENRTGYVLLLRTVYGRRQSVAEASLPGTAGKSEPEAKFFVTT
ncbi:hypothetical protein [Methylococcus sp. Mc7]|uniref:hypothetical protein n=1 Tax=Methylococcus sp. Mc7 TaxID=2860258 RepID=UPI001C532B0A|nr:hypothetical protein [Methylococcus sp. Mc7]QXP85034.1 hypothetical protein KW115_04680 [Methylococcus sp. Mc7]